MAAAAEVLQHVKSETEFNLPRSVRVAASEHGKSPLAQVMEIWRLRFGPGKLRPDEYYAYGLYDDRRFAFEDKLRFLGRATQLGICRACNALEWWLLAHDKLVFYALLKGHGLPAPQTLAIYHHSRGLDGAAALPAPEALAAHLRSAMAYPCFAKPVTGMRSVGVAALEAYDAPSDSLLFKGGRTLGVADFVSQLEPYRKDGYLFQEMLAPHPELEALCGRRLSTVRLIILLEDAAPAILHALWKIPVGDHPADNFWRPGNLLAGLEAASGRVTRVIQGVGPERRELESHPDTGGRLQDLILPEWPALVALGLRAATALPGLRMQAWDIALTDRGPVLVEANIGGDFNLPQLAHGKGLMDERFGAFLSACAARMD
jgi:glutathione synthase/RimK-type ligase-like ATP-grasp enzyme